MAQDGEGGGDDPKSAGAFWEVLDLFDERAERVFDLGRGIPAVDHAAAALSNLSDYGFVWTVIAASRARRSGPGRRRATESLAVAGFTSLLVNKGLKAVIRRPRPGVEPTTANQGVEGRPETTESTGRPAGTSPSGAEAAATTTVSRPRLPVRTPTSSSFPSGHTLAACCTAVVLARNRRELGVFLGFSVAVAASRVHLKAHHPSDVLAGAAIGTGLGLLGRRLLAARWSGRTGD